MRNTLQEQYNLIKEGKGNKQQFFKSVRQLFPNLVTPINTYDDTVRILKNRGIITEGIGGVVTTGKKQDWHAIFNENMANLKEEKEAKAEEKETTKEVTDMATRGYDYKDTKNYDNVFGEEFLKGYYTEMKDPKNEDKTVEELKQIVAKNLAKDCLHYTKEGQFGLKDVGYTVDAPGLGEPKPAKGPHKSSGYGDLKESVLRSQIYLLVKEVLAESIHDKDITSAPHTNVKGKMGDYDPKARAANLASLANFGPKSEPKNIDETSEVRFKVGDIVAYNGEEYEITRFFKDQIYIKSLTYGGRPDTWVKAKDLKKINKPLTPEDEPAFMQAVNFAEDLYDKVGNVEDVLANLPSRFVRYEDDLKQHLTQKFEG